MAALTTAKKVPATAAVPPAPASVRITHGRRVLEMALVGYRAELERLRAEIAEVEALLDLSSDPTDSPTTSD